ncbi:hypothetical protein IT575_14565 [bacterium]|nr:hypothetical protein [bacterium]
MALYGNGLMQDEVPTDLPEGWTWACCEINAEGFLVPYLEAWMRPSRLRSRKTIAEHFTTTDFPAPEAGSSFAFVAGASSKDIWKAQQDALQKMEAHEYPLIPAWLAAAPPRECLFVPNGEILCMGKPGQPVVESSAVPQGETIYRYSHDGKLIDSYSRLCKYSFIDHNWRKIYWPSYGEVGNYISARERGLECHIGLYGYFALMRDGGNSTSDELVELYDYDGSRPDPNSLVPAERRRMCESLSAKQIVRIYNDQVKLGLQEAPETTAAPAPSPGIAEPRIPSAVASQPNGIDPLWTVVRNPALPGNPYLGQYEDWDQLFALLAYWQPLQGQESWTQQFESTLAKLEELDTSGLTTSQSSLLRAMRGLEPARPAKSITLGFDANGWMLPYELLRRQQHDFPNNWDVRPQSPAYGNYPETYFLEVAVPLGRELEAALDAEQWRWYWQSWPQIPQWLDPGSCAQALFVPNGEMILLKPGINEEEKSTRNWMMMATFIHQTMPLSCPEWRSPERWAESYFERYSAAGQLLESRPVGAEGVWQAMYSPQVDARVQAARNAGLDLTYRHGIVFGLAAPGATGEAAALTGSSYAVDWDGTEVDPSQRVARPGKFCQWLVPYELEQIREGQQGRRMRDLEWQP